MRTPSRRLASLLVPALFVAALACGSSTTGGSPGGSGTCGLALYTDAYPATCQAAVDQNCCAAETACGADPGCTAYVTCANACPFPHTDGCLNDCQKTPGVTAEGLVKLNDLASCGKKSPAPEGGASAKCDWPK